MPRKATIGPAVYQRVNELVAEGKSRTEAFAQVGQERGQRPGTVAANYYRTARSEGASAGGRRRSGRAAASTTTGRRRRASRPTRTATRTSAPTRSTSHDGDGDLAALATQIATLTQQLVDQIQERDAKLRQLLA
jgi:hypothetical protein